MAEQRYRVVDRLEAGGMAEVFRGEAASVQGFRKEVAIKRVLPHLAQNRNFIAMFLDEARLGAKLNHANIVAVNDIGAADNTYFIVMEFVDGANLKHLVEHHRRKGRPFPLKEALYIGMEVCRGLSYAHELTDEHGQPLHIVHRDVSPPNVLLSKRGEVKVTDFGLAKAKTQLEKTDPGVVKGKFSYLSPEAAMGLAVDARADLFALGIVIWEMLAGRRLFLGETDYQTVKLVQQANVPDLSRLHPEVDDDLAAIVRRVLAKDRDARFQSAREMGDALAGYLFSHQLKVTSYDIANLVKETLQERSKERRPPQQSIIDRLISEELLRFTSLDDVASGEGQQPLSPESLSGDGGSGQKELGPEGAAALDPGEFENPADWFRGDEGLFGDDALVMPSSHVPGGPAAGAPAAVSAPAASARAPGWREGGIEPDGGARIEDRPTEPHGAGLPAVDSTRRISAEERTAARVAAATPPPLPPRPRVAPPVAEPTPPPLEPAPRSGRDAPPVRFSDPPRAGVPTWLFGVIALGLLLVGAGVAWLLSGG